MYALYKKRVLISTALLVMLLWGAGSEASLELLAGVEAGIDTTTAMGSRDLEKTQQVLTNQKIGDRISWHNADSRTSYQIEINERFTFNKNPCVSYTLTIVHDGKTQIKPLEACLNPGGHWISLNAGTTAL